MQANARPIKFPVMIGTVPTGNAIVIAESTTQLPASMAVSGANGPTISIRPNPSDAYGKVLIISGDEPDQLLKAAQAFAGQEGVFQGNSVHVEDFKLPKAREIDDSPRWLSTETDKPTQFWDYTTQDELQDDGTVPLPVYYRLPPDLYYGERNNLTMQLDYAYNSIPIANQSSLKVRSNGAYIANLPLIPGSESKVINRRELALPIVDLRPFSNTLLFDYFFQIQKQGNCKDTAPTNLYGSILRSSSIDIRGISHWATMPNLELFANAGFPFTRVADLADTKVVVPSSPSGEELGLFLDLMGHMGAMSGYPALRVTVVGPDGLAHDDKDYLVLGTVQDQPAIAKLNPDLPVTLDVGGIKVKDTEGFFSPLHGAWWKIRRDRSADGVLTTIGGTPDATVEGIESPWSPGRSVVVIALREQANAEAFATTFLRDSQSSDVSRSVSVLRGSKFESFQVGSNVYHVGNIPWLMGLRLWFMQYPWLVVILILIICFLLASWSRLWLRRRARIRLQATEAYPYSAPVVPRTALYHSVHEPSKPVMMRVHHNREDCPAGRDIPPGERISGSSGYRLCEDCNRMK
jgi:cellulose synthase (UDP-forming)